MSAVFRNPILPGFHPDPSICRVGDDFYLTNSTFEYFPGLPIYHSKDLIHWELIGNALDRPSQLPLEGIPYGSGLYAPTIRHWKGKFYLVCTLMRGQGAFVVTAGNAAGPWSEPKWLDDPDMDGSLFFDDDGKAYYTKHDGGERGGIAQAEIDADSGKLLGPFKKIWNQLEEPWNEGPHLYKIKGRYYLMLAEGGTAFGHMEVVGRGDSPWGPFEPCPRNPILSMRGQKAARIQCTGHADLVDAPDGTWWLVFLGVRPRQGTSVLGRETFMAQVSWDKDAWPVVNGGQPIAADLPAPRLAPAPAPSAPRRTLFNGPALGPEWLYVRNPDSAAYDFSARPGWLRLHGAAATLDETASPCALFQRQLDFEETVRCRLDFKPGRDGDEAGLAVRANDHQHAEIAMGRREGKDEIFVRLHSSTLSAVLASSPLPPGPLQLQIGCREEAYRFAWSVDGEVWETLAVLDSAPLGQDLAGMGFTGAVLGVYATGNGGPASAPADVEWFEALPGLAPEPGPPMALPSPAPAPASKPAAILSEWRVQAGGKGLKASDGKEWAPDSAFIGGHVTQATRNVAGTEDPALYQNERYGREFSYHFTVPPGRYRLTLKFAELFWGEPGERLMSVWVNGKKALDRLDILKEAGGRDRALDKAIQGVEPDALGRVQVLFKADLESAKVAALELVPE